MPGAQVAGKLHGQPVLHVPAVGKPGELVGSRRTLVGFGKRQQLIAGLETAGLKDKAENRFEGEGGKETDLEVRAVFRDHQWQSGKLEHHNGNEVTKQQNRRAGFQVGEVEQQGWKYIEPEGAGIALTARGHQIGKQQADNNNQPAFLPCLVAGAGKIQHVQADQPDKRPEHPGVGCVAGEPGLGADSDEKGNGGGRQPGEQTRDLGVFLCAGGDLAGGGWLGHESLIFGVFVI